MRVLLRASAAELRAAADGALGPGSAYRRVHALQTHAEAQPAPRLSLLRLHAHLGWRVFGPALAARGHTEATLLHHLMQVQTNVFAVTTLVADAGGGSGVAPLRHVRVGEALYSRACLLNHSCEPNANVAFDGATLELRAAAPLAIGEAVLTCYGPQVGHEPLRARRAKLLNGYFFRCGCVGCAREERDALARRAGSAGGGGDDAARARRGRDARRARARRVRARRLRRRRRSAAPRRSHCCAASFRRGARSSPMRRQSSAGCTSTRAPTAAPAAALRAAADAMEACFGADAEVEELRRLEALCVE